MRKILAYLEQKTEQELSPDPLYAWIRAPQVKDPRRQLDAMIPLLNFALTFPYYNKRYLKCSETANGKKQEYSELISAINKHADEDANHAKYLIQDIKNLQLAAVWQLTKPSDLLWVIWSSPTLDNAREILSKRIYSLLTREHENLAIRYIQIEQIEQDGYYLFSAFNEAVNNIYKTYHKESYYFGKHHLSLESGHVSKNEFLSLDLPHETEILAKKIIDEKHELSVAMNKLIYEFVKNSEHDAAAGSKLLIEKDYALRRVIEEIKLNQLGLIEKLQWEISPKKENCDKTLYERWLFHYNRFKQHPLAAFLQTVSSQQYEFVLRVLMLFFTNRMLSLRSFHLFDLKCENVSPNNKIYHAFTRIRNMFATHSALFFHDWQALNLDQELKFQPHTFLDWLFFDEDFSKTEMIAIHEFKRIAIQKATCPITKIWCYLCINFQAAAFTSLTKPLAQAYHKKYPMRRPLVYMEGILHLLYKDVDPNWNDKNIISDLHSEQVSNEKKELILEMMDQFSDYGIQQWDNVLNFLNSKKAISKCFYTEYDYPNQKQNKLPQAIEKFLYDEQVLHAKDFKYPWPEDSSVFHGALPSLYHPERRLRFPLPYYLVPEEKISYIQADSINEKLIEQFCVKIGQKKYYKLFVHPCSMHYYQFLRRNGCKLVNEKETEFLATPTSSYRSLLVWNIKKTMNNDTVFIVKLTIDKIIFMQDRILDNDEIQKSILIQRLCEEMENRQDPTSKFTVFPEVAGVCPDQNKLSDCPAKVGGYIIRAIPKSLMTGEKRWIPFQALISQQSNGEKLLKKVIKASGLSAESFLKEYFVDKYLAMLEETSFKTGIFFFTHLQNLLLETDADLKPTGNIIVRDLSDAWLDIFLSLSNDCSLRSLFNYKPHIMQFDKKIGIYITYHFYAYKEMAFKLILADLIKLADDFPAHEELFLSEILDIKFIDLVNRYCDTNLEITDLQFPNTFPELPIYLSKLGEKIALATSAYIPANKIDLYPSLKMSLIDAITHGFWCDIGYCLPQQVSNIKLIEKFLSEYQFYGVSNSIIGRDENNFIIGFVILSRIDGKQYPDNKGIFFCYNIAADIWRAFHIRNYCESLTQERTISIECDPWVEEDDCEIKKWIDKQLKKTDVTIVLIGQNTAGRKYINYEILQSIKLGKGLLGIYIHKLRDISGATSLQGENPFDSFTVMINGKKTMLSDVCKTYDWLQDKGQVNIGKWVAAARSENKS